MGDPKLGRIQQPLHLLSSASLERTKEGAQSLPATLSLSVMSLSSETTENPKPNCHVIGQASPKLASSHSTLS